MGLELHRQALALLKAGALGLLLALSYDCLRPPRRNGSTALALALDFLYGLLCACAVFFYAMGAGEGRLGLWSLSAAFLGFLLYWQLFSPLFTPLLASCYGRIQHALGLAKKFSGKLQIFAAPP